MACPNCVKKHRNILQNMNFPNNNDFKLMFYVGSDTQEPSNDSRFLYSDLTYGESYYVYKEDWTESVWSTEAPVFAEEE